MKMLKKICRFSGLLFIGFMFAVCMVTGVVSIIPKRKEQFAIEIKIENIEKEDQHSTGFDLSAVNNK